MPGEVIFDAIPVFCGRVKLFDYWIGNLFSKWGNQDGEDDRLLEIGQEIVDELYDLGYRQMAVGRGLHNSLCILSMKKRGHREWKNRWAADELWEEHVYKKLWNTLPGDVKQVLSKLAKKGIHYSNIYVCLLHDYWNFADYCSYDDEDLIRVSQMNNDEANDNISLEHHDYIVKTLPTKKFASSVISKEEFIDDLKPLSIIDSLRNGALKPVDKCRIEWLVCNALAARMKM